MSLTSMRIAILVFPGSNCDRDMMVAIEKLTGRRPSLVWHKERSLDPIDLAIIPGGFSFGDYLRCGALAARSPVIDAVLDHAARGGAVMGVCNGFQILLESGLLPGALMQNAGLNYICRNITVEVCQTVVSPFTKNLAVGEHLTMPIAHNDGNYFAGKEELARLSDNGQVALRYADGPAHGLANPNGSAFDIAGIISANGRVMGMMPHPERAISPDLGGSDGATFLQGCLEALAS